MPILRGSGGSRMDVAARLRRRLVRRLARLRNLPPARALAALERVSGGRLHVAARHLESGRTLGYNAEVPAPMASTVKVPLVIEVLAQAGEGRFALDDMIAVEPHHLRPGHGIVTARLGAPGVAFSVRRLARLALVESDNTATDLLFSLVGGPAAVAARLDVLGLRHVSVDRTILRMMSDRRMIDVVEGPGFDLSGWRSTAKRASGADREEAGRTFLLDARDTATPDGMVQLLAAIHGGAALSPAGTVDLLAMMERCATGPGRIRAGVPRGARLAHKTGSLPEIVAADVGLVTLPDRGGTLALAVFVVGSGASEGVQDRTIAEATRVACAALA